MADALVLSGVRHSFGNMVALDDAHLRVRQGTVHAVLGENGAGKSTLMRIAFGLLVPDRGTIEVDGRPVRLRRSADAIAAGIGMVHQHFQLVPALTATENVALGGRGLLRLPRVAERVGLLTERAGLAIDPAARVDQMTVGAQQRLEIVRALAHDSRVLILDEPTAVLTPEEGASLLAWVRGFVDAGGTAILITHKLREALAIADDVTVLRRGRTVLARRRNAVDETQLVEAVTGGATSGGSIPAVARAPHATAPRLSVEGVGYTDPRGVVRLQDATLEVRGGEILGVVGVEGSGQRELLRILAGRLRPTHGRVVVPERVGFVPEDRLADALVPEMTLTENLLLAESGTSRGRLDWRAATTRTAELLARADVRASGPLATARELSGGNQQKFVVARERERSESALVVENPTRGLDIVASARVWEELFRAAREQHLAVVVYSPDLDEVRAIADRIVVCFAGRVRTMEGSADGGARADLARALLGGDLMEALAALWDGAFGSWYAILSATMVRATPLVLVGLAVSVAFRAGVLNIGAEGQLLVGASAATAVSFALAGWPRPIAILLMAVAGGLAGAGWAGIAAWLKRRFAVLEVISTLMLNFIAAALVSWLVRGPLQEPTHVYSQSANIPEAAHWPLLIPGHRLHLGFLVGVAAAFATWWVLTRTAVGLRVRLVGASPRAAASAGGVNVARTVTGVFLVSGALAGLAGASEIGGVTWSLYEGLSPGYGYSAIAVALLARLDPRGVIGTALLLGALDAGAAAMQRSAQVPAVVGQVVVAALVLGVLCAQALHDRRLLRGSVHVAEDTR